MNSPGSIISGQVGGDTARLLSERIGKVVQLRHSVHESRPASSQHPSAFSGNWSGLSYDPSVSFTHSTNLDFAVATARISMLSSGEFVGFVADNPRRPITKKAFHCRNLPDPDPAGDAAADLDKASIVEPKPQSASTSNTIPPLPIIRNFGPPIFQPSSSLLSLTLLLVTVELVRMLETPALEGLILK